MPTGLNAAATPTNAKPALTWTSGGADALSGFARYDVYRGATLAGSSTSTSFTDTALSTSGSYSYTVKTIDNAGNVSNASTAKVVVYDVIAPPVPGGFAAPAATKVKPTLTFTAASDTGGSGTDHYNVYRDGALLGVALTTSYTETSTDVPRRLLRVHRERGRQGRATRVRRRCRRWSSTTPRRRSPRPRRPRRRRSRR